MTATLEESVDAVARSEGFSGAIRVDVDDQVVVRCAYGLADRSHSVPNDVATRFAIASGMKGLTAVTVVSLVADRVL